MRILAGLVLSLAIGMVQAASIDFSPAWSRITSNRMAVGGVFMNITNNTDQNDVLVSASTPRAKKVEIHETIDDQGVMRMRELKNGLPLPKGKTVELKPGGSHLMLIGINKQLRLDDQFDLTLKFKSGKTQILKVTVNNGVGMINGQKTVPADAADHSGHAM